MKKLYHINCPLRGINTSFASLFIVAFVGLANNGFAQSVDKKVSSQTSEVVSSSVAKAGSDVSKLLKADTSLKQALSKKQIRINKRLAKKKAAEAYQAALKTNALKIDSNTTTALLANNNVITTAKQATDAASAAGGAIKNTFSATTAKAKKFKSDLAGAKNGIMNNVDMPTVDYSKLTAGIGDLKKKAIVFDLALESKYQYRPPANLIGPAYLPKNALIFNINGKVSAFGIPFNIDVSTGRQNNGGFGGPGGFANDLFKFDMDPKALIGSYENSLQKFDLLKKQMFNGEDLGGYTAKAVADKLNSNSVDLNALKAGSLAASLNDKRFLNKMLVLKPEEVRGRLMAQVVGQKQLAAGGFGSVAEMTSVLGERQTVLDQLKGNASFKERLRSSGLLDKIKNLPADSASKYLQDIAFPEKTETGTFFKDYQVVSGIDIAMLATDALKKKQAAQKKVIEDLSAQLRSPEVGNGRDIDTLLTARSAAYSKQLAIPEVKVGKDGSFLPAVSTSELAGYMEKGTVSGVDSVVSAVADVNKLLIGNGLTADRVLALQKLADPAMQSGKLTEEERAMLMKDPGGGVRSVISRFSAIKFGSFSNDVPGATQGKPLFTDGAHATFKLNSTPLTVGFGSQNDIAAMKDAGFNSTAFNMPRNMTYLGAEFKRGRSGPLKISIIGASSQQSNNNGYSMPAISSSNVAVTISKQVKMGDLGNAMVDVSKTTTLYANKYVLGTEAVLDRQAGLNANNGMDLFQTLSFGMTHQLDITSLGLSDNFYVSYSGLGYQNPGNNGNGGAQFKIGGNLKKAFAKNKLVLGVRTDINNRAISYTSNDKWKNLQIAIDGRYMISKKMNVDLRYINNATSKLVDNISTPVYSFQKFQLGGNANFKIGRNPSISRLTISTQQLSNSYGASSAAGMLMANYTQSLVVKQKVITFNAFYNKEMTGTKLIGDMFNSDLSYQFMLGKKVSLTSAVTYLDNTGIARQIGVREDIQLLSVGHFDIGSNVDLRKNLITAQYPDLYADTRAELSVKYHLNF